MLRLRHLVLIVLLLVGLTIPTQAVTYMQVKITIDDRDQAIALNNLHLDKIDGDNTFAEIITNPEELQTIKAMGFATEIVHADLVAYYQTRLNSERTMGGYKTLSEISASVDTIIADHPSIVSSKIVLGQTIEGRDIWAIKISDNHAIDEDEPELLYTSATHSREVITPLVLLHFIDHITDNYGTDPAITDIVDNREIWFVLNVNPDGYYHNEVTNPSGGGLWRKNRKNNGDGTIGVDLNRNFGKHWGFDDAGSSPVTSSATYRGTGPFSEPESQVMRDFIESREFVISIWYHSYSNLLLWPWGYDYLYTDDEMVFREIGDSVSNWNGYAPGPGWILYLVNGDTDDWCYGEQTTKNKIFSMTPEVGSSGDGFWPDPSRIPQLISENLEPNLFYCRIADNMYELAPPTPPDLILAPEVDSVSYTVDWSPTDSINLPLRYELVEFQNYQITTDLGTNFDSWNDDGFTVSFVRSNSPSSSFFSGSGDALFNTMTSKEKYLVQTNDTLSMWMWFQIEDNWDYAYVEVSTNGLNYTPLAGNVTTTSNPNGTNRGNGITGFNSSWTEAKFPLQSFVGQAVFIRITYSTDGWVTEAGLWVDDIYPVGEFASETLISSNLTDTSYTFTNKPLGSYYYKVKQADLQFQWGEYSLLKGTNVVTSSLCVDSDGDGYGDPGNPSNTCPDDNCPTVFNNNQSDVDADGLGDICDSCTDTDSDGFGNPGFPDNTCADDNCPNVANPGQEDVDGDGIGSACDDCVDTDGDGFGDTGYGNSCTDDNCESDFNPTQADGDSDGLGDICDDCTDSDGDGFGDPGVPGPGSTCADDDCPDVANPGQEDADSDGIGDACDDCTDTDGDGFGDPGFTANTCGLDNCPDVPNPTQDDANSDGIGDACCCQFVGNFNGDAVLDISDLTALVDYLFRSGEPADCPLEADTNGDSTFNISDLTCLVDYMFRGAPECFSTCP